MAVRVRLSPSTPPPIFFFFFLSFSFYSLGYNYMLQLLLFRSYLLPPTKTSTKKANMTKISSPCLFFLLCCNRNYATNNKIDQGHSSHLLLPTNWHQWPSSGSGSFDYHSLVEILSFATCLMQLKHVACNCTCCMQLQNSCM
jgi:hypothetical protein